jgi:hypothetical protein
MNCQQCLEMLDNLLAADLTPDERAALNEHVETCPACARQYELANEALAAITPTSRLPLSADFKERVMSAISDVDAFQPELLKSPIRISRLWKQAAIVAAAALLLLALLPVLRPGPGPHRGGRGFSAFSLLAEAHAAEEQLFVGNQIVHLLNEIVVTPVGDPQLAKARWFPLVSLDATGKTHMNQLTLAGEPGKGYTIEDKSWYDPAKGRFLRIMTIGNRPIFANSFDGANVYTLESSPNGGSKVKKEAVGKDFRPPKSPAEFLGIATGLQSAIDRKDNSLIEDVGKIKLDDGTEAYVVKSGFPKESGPKELKDSYALFTIRADNNLIEKMEMIVNGKSMYAVRRGKGESGKEPTVGWDLAGVVPEAAAAPGAPGVGVVANMVVPNISVEQMVKKADFAPYLFSKDPVWAGQREITDVLDIPSPPYRMFVITYRAKDGRDVVLVQGHSFNTMLGQLAKTGKLIYTTPSGVKVWSGPRDQWLANILLQSAQASIRHLPVKEPTGYQLETPDKTFPVLAINGKVTQEELHVLIDSLVPAKK